MGETPIQAVKSRDSPMDAEINILILRGMGKPSDPGQPCCLGVLSKGSS